MRGFRAFLLVVLSMAALGSCGPKPVERKDSAPAPTAPATVARGDSIPAAADKATLVAFVLDSAGAPVEDCQVRIRRLFIGGLTDARGFVRIPGATPGTWMVSWRLIGYFDDSMRVRFEPGRVETLRVTLKGPEPERAGPFDHPRR